MQAIHKSKRFSDTEVSVIEADLSHMRSIDLTDSELEFLYMKRGRKVYDYSPDPRLGDYEN